MGRKTAAALALCGALLGSACGERHFGRSSEDLPKGPVELPAATLHYKHPIALTALHRVNVSSGNHPDILLAGVRPTLEVINPGGPGIVAQASVTYETEARRYEFDLATGTIARLQRVPDPKALPLSIVKPPDQGGDRAAYVALVKEMRPLIIRVAGGPWDWVSGGPRSPLELRQAASYLESVLRDVEQGRSLAPSR